MDARTSNSRREMSADDVNFRSRGISNTQASTFAKYNYGTKKKYEVNEEQENLIDKCMLSWPNKFSLE